MRLFVAVELSPGFRAVLSDDLPRRAWMDVSGIRNREVGT